MKFDIRNPQSETNSNSPIRNENGNGRRAPLAAVNRYAFRTFRLLSLFRASFFGFRIFRITVIASRLTVAMLGWALPCCLVAAPIPAPFSDPAPFTNNDAPAGKMRMTRSTSGQIAWGDAPRVSLVYWEGREDAVLPHRSWFRQWDPHAGWGARERIEQSFGEGGVEVGGRHPAMVALDDGSFVAVWNDYRHGLHPAYITNIEIYAQRRPADGSFASSATLEQRLSDTPDNGYLPRITRLLDGRLAVAWYDFHYNNNEASELALRIGAADGDFTQSLAAAPIRLTDLADRAAGDEGKSFIMPSPAPATTDTLALCWVTLAELSSGLPDTSSPASLYFGLYDLTAGAWSERGRLLANRVRGYFDPPKLIRDPASGDLWLLYVDSASHPSEEVYLARRPAGAGTFEDPVRITDDGNRSRYPDAAIDADGRLHLVWVDDPAGSGNSHVRYAVYDPELAALTLPVDLTPEHPREWERPAIALEASGHAFVVWEENINGLQGHLWFTTNWTPNAAAAAWLTAE